MYCTHLFIYRRLNSYSHKACVNSPLSLISRLVPIRPPKDVSLADWYAICDLPIPFNSVLGETAIFIPGIGEKTAELARNGSESNA